MRNISSSVGLRGVNQRDNVRTVQELLNLVPHADGGPMIKLDTDGICGRKTNGAIEKLQAHEWGWKQVTTRVDPNSPTWKLLLTYDKPAQPTALPAPKPPEPPKALGTRFMVMMAVKPGQQLNAENFYFQIIDQSNQTQKAIYFFGNANVPPPNPTPWSITIPPIVNTPQPLGVADWAGTAIFYERSRDGNTATEIFVSPDVLNGKMIRFGIHAYLDQPSKSPGAISSQFSAPFRLREVS